MNIIRSLSAKARFAVQFGGGSKDYYSRYRLHYETLIKRFVF
jgi:hypothetical protein